MFTGIISAMGCITNAERPSAPPLASQTSSGDLRLTIKTPTAYLDDVSLGDSIALNGACMTVTHLEPKSSEYSPYFTVAISVESLTKTAGLHTIGQRINLEKALRAGDPLGGHLVSGHVDGVASVTHFAPVASVADSWALHIETSLALAPYFTYKGSVAVNGVSLTINQVTDSDSACMFIINLIPHTLKHTTLGALRVGNQVNIEVDTIARYVARMLGSAKP